MNKKRIIYRYIFWDLVAAIVVWVLFMMFRRIVNDGVLFQNITVFVPNYNYYTNLALFPLFSLFVHYLTGYYVNPIKDSRFSEILITLVSTSFISIVIFFVLLLDDMVVSYEYYYYSLLVLIVLLFTATLLVRTVQSLIVQSKFKKRKWTIKTIVVGTGQKAQALAEEFDKYHRYNHVIGFVRADNNAYDVVDSSLVLGKMAQVGKVIEQYDVKEVVVALDESSDIAIFEIINKLFIHNVEIYFTPRQYEILTGKVRFQRKGVQPLVSVTHPTMSDWELCVKRTFDLSVSLVSLVLVSPILLLFAIAIKIDSKGSVFFRQNRIGMNGKTFKMLKLRTMYENAESGVPRLSSPDDSRITRIGRFLRKYRIDEVPQFFNIIKGDMSIVGPRPERKFYIDQIIKQAPYYCMIYRLRPGLTSWGPIKVGYADTVEKMIERLNYDIIYLENMTLTTDAKIIFSTLEIIFHGKGQ